MMVSTKGRYALRVFIDLAQHETDGYVSLSEIASRQDVSLKYLETIVATLVRSGLLKSQRGISGGYILTKPASEITVLQILDVTEGNLSPVACINCGDSFCTREGKCLTKPMWEQLNTLVNDFFDNITIQDIVDKKIVL